MKKFFPFVTCLFLVLSCTSKKEQLARVWFYDSSDFPSEKEIGPPSGFNSMEYSINLQPYSFIDLQKDGTYSCDIGAYESGRWYFKEGIVKLVNQDKQVLDLELRAIKDDIVQLLHRSRGAVYTFQGFDNDFKSQADNPFAPQNNIWRIKAEEEEGSLQITRRIKNYFRYWEKYFDWGIRIEKTTLDVRSLPGPIKMYANGFSLVPLEDQPKQWVSQFYSPSENLMAFQKLDSFFRYKDINWKKTDNKFEMFRDAFRQAQEKIGTGYEQ
jgi:hypothetical protein